MITSSANTIDFFAFAIFTVCEFAKILKQVTRKMRVTSCKWMMFTERALKAFHLLHPVTLRTVNMLMADHILHLPFAVLS
jgi:hypothetical protein